MDKAQGTCLTIATEALESAGKEILFLRKRLEECEVALRLYANEKNWKRSRLDGPVDVWVCCDEENWHGPDAARAALEEK